MVRPAREEDWAALRDLRLEGLQAHPRAFGSSYEEELVFSEATWRDRSSCSERKLVALAEEPSGLLGMAGLMLDSHLKSRHVGNLVAVYVRPSGRGRGVADSLIAFCLEWAAANGATVVYLGVARDNDAALRCYQRAGFVQYGLEPRSLLVEGEYVDECLMAKLLTPVHSA